MKQYLLPFAGVVAAIAVFVGFGAAIGAFDNDNGNDSARDAVADEAKCAADATDCHEPTGDDTFGVCISEDDPNYDPEQPCEDTGEEAGGPGLNMCAADVPDCNDMDLGNGASENTCLAGATDCNDTPSGTDSCDPDQTADCEERVHEIVITDMETNIGSVATIVSSEYVDWPDSCLGVDTEGVSCAQVITPGFKVVVEAGGEQVEYHTDLRGGFAIAD